MRSILRCDTFLVPVRILHAAADVSRICNMGMDTNHGVLGWAGVVYPPIPTLHLCELVRLSGAFAWITAR